MQRSKTLDVELQKVERVLLTVEIWEGHLGGVELRQGDFVWDVF